jgi:hypothetical protein
MLDQLVPQDYDEDSESFLSLREVLRRLHEEFRIVQVDRKRGHDSVQASIGYLEKLESKDSEIREKLDRLRATAQQASYVYLADRDEPGLSYLTTVLTPDEPIMFGYASLTHQEQARPLLERASKALDYYIEEL